MIVFSCPACQKKLSIKDDLGGKKGKCPGCGQMMAFPQHQRTQPPHLDVLTHPPSSDLEATQGAGKLRGSHGSSLTDFLAPPQADDELGRLGKYRILKILGHGGMGVVYKAEDPKLKRSVAIKAMLPVLAASASAGKRFLREAQAMAAVEHDHIVRIYQVDEDRGVPFLAMEFLKGEPLDERLKRSEKLPLSEVLRIGREIAEALGASHTTGLIHRDIKPANIWLEAPRNRVKILDFGLVRAVSQESDLTQQGAIVGTPAFMAPEQGRGEAVDARCDLFSLGVVLYRLCTGQQPFKGKDTASTLLAIALDQPPPPIQLNHAIPQELSDLVMMLLEKEPDRRPASAGVVVEILQTLERESLEDTVALKPAAAGTRGWRLPLVVAAVLLLGLIGVGVWRLILKHGAIAKETPAPVDDAWLKLVAAMPAAKQVEAVTAKLKERNPGFDGEVTHMVEAGEVTQLELLTDNVTDVSPVRALTGLRTLKCNGTWGNGQLADLSPLKDMKLTLLYCHCTKVSDLSPLKDMKLTQLNCGYTKVADLSPLKDMKLTVLYCTGTKVSDLTPLRDMKLTILHCQNTRVTDLSPLKGMLLKDLHCDFKPERDAEILRSIKTLETINGKPAKDVLKEVDSKRP